LFRLEDAFMNPHAPHSLLGPIHRLFAVERRRQAADGDLLRAFVQQGEQDAFAELLRRHGPMVLRLALHLLHHRQDAEDVFQATFLALARKAHSLRNESCVAAWLHRVAWRLSLRSRAALRRTAGVSRLVSVNQPADAGRSPDPADEISLRESQTLLHQELAALPERLRLPLVLCYLQGRTRDEAARRLGWSLSTFKRRLEQARKLLHARLSRRGVALSAVLSASLLASPEVSASLVEGTLNLAKVCVTGASSGVLPCSVAALMVETSLLAKWKAAGVVVLMLSVFSAGAWIYRGQAEDSATPAKPSLSGQPPVAGKGDKADPARDLFGDPLPPGAIARLGTVRFRGDPAHVAFSPDGKWIATAGYSATAYLWDAATGKELHRFHATGGIGVMAVSPKGDRLAVSGGAVEVFDTATGKQLYDLGNGRRRGVIGALAFAPDGKVLITATDNAADPIMVWDVAAGKYLRSFQGKPGPIVSLVYSSDGKCVASCGQDKIIRLWDPDAGTERGRLAGHEKDITSLVFAGGGKLLVSSGMDQTIRIWDVASHKEVHRLAEKHGGVKALAVSRDGRTLACGNENGTLGLWEIDKGQELRHWKGDVFGISSVAFAPDGKSLITGSRLTCSPRQWDVATGRELHAFGGHRSPVNWLSFSPDGRQLLSAAYAKTALRWDLRSGREERRFSWPTEHFDHFLPSPDGKTAVTLGYDWDGDGVVRLWDTTTGKEQRVLGRVKTGALGVVTRTVTFSPDGKLLAAGSGDGTVFLWEVATGKERRRWRKISGYIDDLAFSPDGKGLAAATWILGDRTLRYWDVTTGKDLCDIESRGRVGYIAFAPNGKLLASAGLGEDKSNSKYLIRLWDATTGKQILLLDTPGDLIGSLAFSPDNRFLAACRGWFDNAPIYVWEVVTGQEVCQFRGNSSLSPSLCFSPDGSSLASGGGDSTILLWDLTGRRIGDSLQPARLTDRQLATSWQKLAGADAGQAYRAAWLLASDTERTVPFLQRQWQSLLAVDEKKLARQIADLDCDQFEVRERARMELEKQGVVVLSALQQALRSGPSLELRRRVEQIQEKLNEQLLRLRRMVFALEHLGTPPARQLLADIAIRKLDEQLTHEARAAVQRLQSARPTKPKEKQP
jgi:RNA polymerase sigma factor (sigma-70 family)